jgi:hypothetical protein
MFKNVQLYVLDKIRFKSMWVRIHLKIHFKTNVLCHFFSNNRTQPINQSQFGKEKLKFMHRNYLTINFNFY